VSPSSIHTYMHLMCIYSFCLGYVTCEVILRSANTRNLTHRPSLLRKYYYRDGFVFASDISIGTNRISCSVFLRLEALDSHPIQVAGWHDHVISVGCVGYADGTLPTVYVTVN
jgi:hypothetical protein